MNAPVHSVVIVGGGTTAWLCAAALKRAFQHRGLELVVVDPGRFAGDALGRWTLPSLRSVHSLLGLKESDLVRRTGATFRLGSEHRGWQGDASRFVHVHGDLGITVHNAAFHEYLALRALMGRPENPEEYSLAAVAARTGKFARPMNGHTPLSSSFTYGLHLDDLAYCEYLRQFARGLGVSHISAQLHDVTFREDGGIASLLLADGQRISADCFLDCSGQQALLMNRVGAADWQDWSPWLHNDRMVTSRALPLDDPPAVTRTDATDAGWLWRIPLGQSSVAGYVYSSKFCGDNEAIRQLRHYAPCVSEPTLCNLRQGRRTQPWTRNCIAIGASAVELEPLIGADLHLTQLGIATFIELFPLDPQGTTEAFEYNRIIGEHADALRDFTIAHYRVGVGRSAAHWGAMRAEPLPQCLAEKLDLYCANGRILLRDHETFGAADWAWLLLGSGCLPDAIGLHARANLASAPAEHIAGLRVAIERLAASMPGHMDFVRQQR
jgi:tryptophan halogenase